MNACNNQVNGMSYFLSHTICVCCRFDFTVKPAEVLRQNLEITVKHYESLFSKVEIGTVTIPLAILNIDKPTTKW